MRGGGVPKDAKISRRRRLTATAKARARQAAVALDRARARAAKALAPDPDAVQAHRAALSLTARVGQSTGAEPVTITRHDTGAQIRIWQTSDAEADGAEAFAVECLSHPGEPRHLATLKQAMNAARRSEQWCQGCEELMLVRPKARDRARRHVKQG